jgi:MoxR-like ATPase
VHRSLQDLLESLNQGLIDRDEALRVCLLGALSGRNVLLLGPPGTAKSLLARRVAQAFGDARFFQYLLTRFTTPDELFGPVSLRALKDQDLFRRRTEGYLPQAEVVFLDEVFKASSAILNALLTVVNEGLFFNGSAVEPVPLKVLIAASNETPADPSLAALYDRFPLRVLVEPVRSPDHFDALLTASAAPVEIPRSLQLDATALDAIRAQAADVTLSPAALAVIHALRALLAAEGDDPQRWYVSDRRWRQLVGVLQVSAACHGRAQVQPIDCGLLGYGIWSDPQDAQRAHALVHAALVSVSGEAELDLGPVGVRWRAVLGELVLHEQALSDRVQSWTLSDGRQITPDQLASWRTNTWETVVASGDLYWDGERFRRIERAGRRGLLVGAWAVDDAETWDRLIVDERPVFASEPVELEPVMGEGAQVDLAQTPAPSRARWSAALAETQVELDRAETQRQARLRQLQDTVDAHLFVGADQVSGLRQGLIRAGLALAAWRERVAGLQRALDTQGTWASDELA